MRIQSTAFAALLMLSQSAVAMGQVPKNEAAIAIDGSIVAGWVEYGWLGDPPIRVKVKLDTGAQNSSINAPSYREFEREGLTYASFPLVNGSGHETSIEAPIVRHARIRRAGVGVHERPVVLMKICVAGVTSEVEFTLADRTGLNYLILIGRTFLAKQILVDSANTFVTTGMCKS